MGIGLSHHASGAPSALLVAHRGASHHLVGVGSALRNAGWVVQSETLQNDVPVRVCARSVAQSHVVVHADSDPRGTQELREQARAVGVPMVLQMDGVLEYANTFLNPRFPRGLLQPAPADLVLACGLHDRAILEALGNRAIANGLPRLDVFRDRLQTNLGDSQPRGLLIATANQAWFTPGMRARLMRVLQQLQLQLQRMRIPVRWRVSAEISQLLGVERDTADLVHSLGQVEGVITTASTLAMEAMMAQKPTGILHPHPWPLWIPCINRYGGEIQDEIEDDLMRMRRLNGAEIDSCRAAQDSLDRLLAGTESRWADSLDRFIESILHAETGALEAQQRIVQGCVHAHAARDLPGLLEPIAKEAKIDTWVRPMQIDDASDRLLTKAVQALAASGSQRIVIAASTLPTVPMLAIAHQPPPELVGFVVPIETDREVLLGLPAAGPLRFIEQLQPDAMVLTAPEDDLSILGAMLWGEFKGLRIVEDEPNNPKFAHARSVIGAAKCAAQLGGVRTTLASGLCAGLVSMDPEAVLKGEPPKLVLLRGEGTDFELYQRARPFRESGTKIRSLRWSERELFACERFSQLVKSFDGRAYAIYGAGLHTIHLLRHGLIDSRPSFILDDKTVAGTQLEGVEVISPADPKVREMPAIVISSGRFESDIWERCGGLQAQGIEVHRLYDDASSYG